MATQREADDFTWQDVAVYRIVELAAVLAEPSAARDPWGNAYTFKCDPKMVVTSNGADGKPGTSDDIIAH